MNTRAQWITCESRSRSRRSVGEVPESKVHDGKIEINTDSIFLTTIVKVNQTDIVNINTVTAKFRYEIIK